MKDNVCKICGSVSQKFESAGILGNKYDVNFWHCSKCNFVQTDEPFWLEEAYLTGTHYAYLTNLIERNLVNGDIVSFFMKFIPNGICMDFGGGRGLLTRIMRDYGFDFYNYDRYAKNEFAYGFDADISKKYTLITAFEVLEHFANPVQEIEMLMDMTDVLFFSTSLVSSPPPLVKDWGYYATSDGRHVSFFSLESLKFIAQKYGWQLLTNETGLHIFSKIPISKKFFRYLRWYNKIKSKFDVAKRFKKESKISEDFNYLNGHFYLDSETLRWKYKE